MGTFNTVTVNQPGKLVKPILFSVLANLASMAPFMILALVVNEIYRHYAEKTALDIGILWLYVAAAFVCMFVVWALESLAYRQCYRGAFLASTDARATLAEHVRKLPLGTLLARDPNKVSSTMTDDFLLLEEANSQMVPQIIAGFCMPVLACLGLCLIDVRMACALFAGLPVALAIIGATTKLERRFGQRHADARLEMSKRVSEYLWGMPVIKAFNLRGENNERLGDAFRRFMKESIRLEGGLGPFFLVAIAVVKAGVSLIAVVGVYLILGGEITVPVLAMFLLVGTRIFDPLAVAVIKFGQFKYNIMAGERVVELLDQPVMAGTGTVCADCAIRFEDVSFTYDATPVLKGVNATFCPGTLSAIVGPSGSGKSTMLRLIARFYDPQKGSVLYGDVDIRSADPEKVLSHIAVVFQDVYLFEDTVAANIGYGREGATREEVKQAARWAQCDEFIEALPDGYDTLIGEGGSTLSGGEKQRISIARALLKNAPIILLDEATASLDPENEVEVQNAIARLVQGRTVIMVAHRLKTVVRADTIYVLDGGRMVEEGSHAELLARKGLYAHMWDVQMRTEGWHL